MSQEESAFDVDTLKTDDLVSNRSGLETLRRRTLSIDARIKKLVLENEALRYHLRIFQETQSLRSATVVATLLAWIDDNCPCDGSWADHSTNSAVKDKPVFGGTHEKDSLPKKSNIQSILRNEENESPPKSPRRRASPRTSQDRDSGQGQSAASASLSYDGQRSDAPGQLTSAYTERSQAENDDTTGKYPYLNNQDNPRDLISFVSADKFNFGTGKGSRDRSSQFVEWRAQLVSPRYSKGGESLETPRSAGNNSTGGQPPSSPFSIASLPIENATQHTSGPVIDNSRQRTQHTSGPMLDNSRQRAHHTSGPMIDNSRQRAHHTSGPMIDNSRQRAQHTSGPMIDNSGQRTQQTQDLAAPSGRVRHYSIITDPAGMHETEIVQMEVHGPTVSIEGLTSDEDWPEEAPSRPAGYTWVKGGHKAPTGTLGQPLAASTPTGHKFNRGVDDRRLASNERLIVIQGAGSEPTPQARPPLPADQDFRLLQQHAVSYSMEPNAVTSQQPSRYAPSRGENRTRFADHQASPYYAPKPAGAHYVSQNAPAYGAQNVVTSPALPQPVAQGGVYHEESVREKGAPVSNLTPHGGRERSSTPRSPRTPPPENPGTWPQRPKTPDSQLGDSTASRPRTPTGGTYNQLASASGLLRDANGVLGYPGNSPVPVEFGTPELHKKPPPPTSTLAQPVSPQPQNNRLKDKPPMFPLEDIQASPSGLPSTPRHMSPATLAPEALAEAPLKTQSIGDIPQQGGGKKRAGSSRRQRNASRPATQNVWAQDSDGNWYDISKPKPGTSRDQRPATHKVPVVAIQAPTGVLQGPGPQWTNASEVERRRAFYAALSHIKTPTRLIGEIAFQLDRRILNFIFQTTKSSREKRRFYGYTIANIDEKMRQESLDPTTGLLDTVAYTELRTRYEYLVSNISALGYDISYHGHVASELVNKYGLLPLPPNREDTRHFQSRNRDLFEEVLVRITPAHEMRDVHILLWALAWMASGDGKPMVAW